MINSGDDQEEYVLLTEELKQKAKEQINVEEFKKLSIREKFNVLDKFFDDNSNLIAEWLIKDMTKDMVNVRDIPF